MNITLLLFCSFKPIAFSKCVFLNQLPHRHIKDYICLNLHRLSRIRHGQFVALATYEIIKIKIGIETIMI